MASLDVREILELEEQHTAVTKDTLFNDPKKKKLKKPNESSVRKPEGMHRELWGLLWTDQKNAPAMMPTDTQQGYKQMKAKIGQSRVRPWKWMPFTNPARKDDAVFHHWRRVADEGKEYPFARFNKHVDVPTYSDLEYQQHLHNDNWPKAETDYLYDMCRKYDLRFIVMHDRWDREKYPNRSVEDLKERYYGIANTLAKLRAPQDVNTKVKVYDADHERRRKDQLNKLFNRTQEQISEEEQLMGELKKIEQRKKEREKKTQDLQKLISAADSNIDSRKGDRKQTKKKVVPQKTLEKNINPEGTGIKFPDFKTSGVSLRSQRIKLPASVGQKKAKAIEQVIDELGIDLNPTATEEICTNFNELRQDIVLLYELKLALMNCEYELQTLRHRFETLAPGKRLPELGALTSLLEEAGTSSSSSTSLAATIKEESPAKQQQKKIAETIDVLATSAPPTPQRKRKAAIEQGNVLKKLKQKV